MVYTNFYNMENTNMKNNLLHPWTLTGITDAEGNFSASIIRMNDKRSSEFAVTVSFEIGLNAKDKVFLEQIKATFGVGNISYNPQDNTYRLKVTNVNDLSNVIIPHFIKYPLVTQKRVDFEFFAKIVEILKKKGHLNSEGLQQIVNLKASWHEGLSDNLKKSFPDTVLVSRPNASFTGIPDPNWLSGFADGEACFYISIYKSLKSKLGFAVQLVFKITQHSRDRELLMGIADYFSCGRVEDRKTKACDFTINSFNSFDEKIIPFFLKYPLQGSKFSNFQDFKKVMEIMKVKGHLTQEGLDEIIQIKSNMNQR